MTNIKMIEARLDTIKAGDTLVPDGGFDCMAEGEYRSVAFDDEHKPYVECSQGRHYLAGQVGADGTLVGLKKAVST